MLNVEMKNPGLEAGVFILIVYTIGMLTLYEQ
jgi:hypothetical protein